MNRTILVRYLSRECSEREKERVEEWLEKDPQNRIELKELEKIWKASERTSSEEPDDPFNAEEDWRNLAYRIGREEGLKISEGSGTRSKKPSARAIPLLHSRLTQMAKIAAILLFGALIGALTWQSVNMISPVEEGPTVREIAVEKGQRSNIMLTDGTNVKLNADSKISMPEFFRPDKREIHLVEGEAYFEVAEDPDKPFLIHSGGSVIRVLGTSFSVRSYPEDDGVRVVVKEGTVSLAPDGEENGGVVLTAEQLGLFSFADQSIASEKVEDVELYLSWTEGYLKFQDASMKEVAATLERKYNVQVKFRNPELAEMKLTAELKGRSILSVLNVISASLDIDYLETDQQTITFFN
ncbi:MAG: FecR domain-containing protein [Balneolaceae bacterium]